MSLEFHCVLQLQDRSRNVNGTFMSGWIVSSSYIFGGSLAELLRFAGLQHAFWKDVSYKMHLIRCHMAHYLGWIAHKSA